MNLFEIVKYGVSCREAAEKDRCPVCGREKSAAVREENPAFDWARFQTLQEEAEA